MCLFASILSTGKSMNSSILIAWDGRSSIWQILDFSFSKIKYLPLKFQFENNVDPIDNIGNIHFF